MADNNLNQTGDNAPMTRRDAGELQGLLKQINEHNRGTRDSNEKIVTATNLTNAEMKSERVRRGEQSDSGNANRSFVTSNVATPGPQSPIKESSPVATVVKSVVSILLQTMVLNFVLKRIEILTAPLMAKIKSKWNESSAGSKWNEMTEKVKSRWQPEPSRADLKRNQQQAEVIDALRRGRKNAESPVSEPALSPVQRPEPPPKPEKPVMLSRGTHGQYIDFGAGTSAILHGKERVMTEMEGRDEESPSREPKQIRGISRMKPQPPNSSDVEMKRGDDVEFKPREYTTRDRIRDMNQKDLDDELKKVKSQQARTARVEALPVIDMDTPVREKNKKNAADMLDDARAKIPGYREKWAARQQAEQGTNTDTNAKPEIIVLRQLLESFNKNLTIGKKTLTKVSETNAILQQTQKTTIEQNDLSEVTRDRNSDSVGEDIVTNLISKKLGIPSGALGGVRGLPGTGAGAAIPPAVAGVAGAGVGAATGAGVAGAGVGAATGAGVAGAGVGAAAGAGVAGAGAGAATVAGGIGLGSILLAAGVGVAAYKLAGALNKASGNITSNMLGDKMADDWARLTGQPTLAEQVTGAKKDAEKIKRGLPTKSTGPTRPTPPGEAGRSGGGGSTVGPWSPSTPVGTPTPAGAATSGSPSKDAEQFDYNTLADTLGARESNNNYAAENTLGYIGKYQFGAMALEDAGLLVKGASKKGNIKKVLNDPKNWTIPGGKMTFFGDSQMQEKAMRGLVGRNLLTLKRIGVIGPNTTAKETAGYLAAAHLVGAGGVKKGGMQSKDAYGTSAGSYFTMASNAQQKTKLATASPVASGAASPAASAAPTPTPTPTPTPVRASTPIPNPTAPTPALSEPASIRSAATMSEANGAAGVKASGNVTVNNIMPPQQPQQLRQAPAAPPQIIPIRINPDNPNPAYWNLGGMSRMNA